MTTISQKAFSHNDLASLLGLAPNGLHTWRRRGLIRPDYPGKGRGNQHGYSWRNVLEICLIKYLKDCGFTLDKVAETMEQIRELERARGEPILPTFISKGGHIYLEGRAADGCLVVCRTYDGKIVITLSNAKIQTLIEDKTKPFMEPKVVWDTVAHIQAINFRALVQQANRIIFGI